LIVVDYTFSTDKTFLSSLKQGLKALGHPPAPSPPNKDPARAADKERPGSWLSRLNKTTSQQTATMGRADPPDTGVCIETPSPDPRYAGINDCYPLPLGDYRSQFPSVKNWHMTYHYMLLLVDFVDQTGNSLLRHGPALALASGAVLLRLIPKAYSTDPDLRIELPAFKGQRGRFQVPVEEITDLGRVSKVAIVPVATDWQLANERPPHDPIDWSHNTLLSALCQNAVLYDMPACTPVQTAVQELRLRARH
jgi:hypothetical protein